MYTHYISPLFFTERIHRLELFFVLVSVRYLMHQIRCDFNSDAAGFLDYVDLSWDKIFFCIFWLGNKFPSAHQDFFWYRKYVITSPLLLTITYETLFYCLTQVWSRFRLHLLEYSLFDVRPTNPYQNYCIIFRLTLLSRQNISIINYCKVNYRPL